MCSSPNDTVNLNQNRQLESSQILFSKNEMKVALGKVTACCRRESPKGPEGSCKANLNSRSRLNERAHATFDFLRRLDSMSLCTE